jgi:hypothetical protein
MTSDRTGRPVAKSMRSQRWSTFGIKIFKKVLGADKKR